MDISLIQNIILAALFSLFLSPLTSVADPLGNCAEDLDGLRPPCEGAGSCNYEREVDADLFMTDSVTNTVDVTSYIPEFFTISPIDGQTPERKTGFIFIHGGGVDSTAYSGYASALAEQGFPSAHILYESVISCTPTPPNTAATASAVTEIITTYPNIERWVVGGHSLGTTLTDYYMRSGQLASKVVGFVYLAGYTFDVGNNDPMPNELKGLLLLASQDNVLTWQSAYDSGALYPDDMTFICVEGGNHGQFGWYGEQAGDGTALISPQEQHDITIAQILAFMIEIDGTLSKKIIKNKKRKVNKSSNIQAEILACNNSGQDIIPMR
ncbi:MAG: hypothetical protein COA90_10755 [Gammaproteobacteria bacterium]|nr:MAG: hypothetical protein COA90_10755 [Gammaproteobacteria bacterium]